MHRDVSLAQAVDILAGVLPEPKVETVGVYEAGGRVLAADLESLVDHPSLDDSALDGYAVRLFDTAGASAEAPARLRVVGEVPAGGLWAGRLGAGEAVRIFTGAPVPEGADAVSMVEHTRIEGGDVLVFRPASADGVRPRAQDLETGRTYLRRGARLRPAHLALAAAMGHARLPVLERPRLAVLSTGDEVREPGSPLPPGGVYNSNAPGLAAAVREMGGEAAVLPRVPDEIEPLRAALDSAKGAHLLLCSGGVSMGERDLVRRLLETEGTVHFWRIRLRPGGPPLCGDWQGTPVFGLPGNPVSALVVFLVVVKPALYRRWGMLEPPYETVRAVARTPFRGAGPKLALLRAVLEPDTAGFAVGAFPNQSSGVLRSLVEANALAVVPPGTDVAPGETLEVIRL